MGLCFLICKPRRLDKMIFKSPLNLCNFQILFPEVRCTYLAGDLGSEYIKGFWISGSSRLQCYLQQTHILYYPCGWCCTGCQERNDAQVLFFSWGFLQHGIQGGVVGKIRKVQLYRIYSWGGFPLPSLTEPAILGQNISKTVLKGSCHSLKRWVGNEAETEFVISLEHWGYSQCYAWRECNPQWPTLLWAAVNLKTPLWLWNIFRWW